jgi:hypothetical protein
MVSSPFRGRNFRGLRDQAIGVEAGASQFKFRWAPIEPDKGNGELEACAAYYGRYLVNLAGRKFLAYIGKN